MQRPAAARIEKFKAGSPPRSHHCILVTHRTHKTYRIKSCSKRDSMKNPATCRVAFFNCHYTGQEDERILLWRVLRQVTSMSDRTWQGFVKVSFYPPISKIYAFWVWLFGIWSKVEIVHSNFGYFVRVECSSCRSFYSEKFSKMNFRYFPLISPRWF